MSFYITNKQYYDGTTLTTSISTTKTNSSAKTQLQLRVTLRPM